MTLTEYEHLRAFTAALTWTVEEARLVAQERHRRRMEPLACMAPDDPMLRNANPRGSEWR